MLVLFFLIFTNMYRVAESEGRIVYNLKSTSASSLICFYTFATGDFLPPPPTCRVIQIIIIIIMCWTGAGQGNARPPLFSSIILEHFYENSFISSDCSQTGSSRLVDWELTWQPAAQYSWKRHLTQMHRALMNSDLWWINSWGVQGNMSHLLTCPRTAEVILSLLRPSFHKHCAWFLRVCF